ncbi:hypothetical protein C4D60_Mb06t26810 [Musa balbisiana]|uniref:Uncharacterized protein n=1 Tax=Musa balbisiana TaxID=52838 RepID=A0A4S8IRM3_MUSBA|nr:hypothetical protein C4D60_Mb06t26810 [Musa balbisiana]
MLASTSCLRSPAHSFSLLSLGPDQPWEKELRISRLVSVSSPPTKSSSSISSTARPLSSLSIPTSSPLSISIVVIHGTSMVIPSLSLSLSVSVSDECCSQATAHDDGGGGTELSCLDEVFLSLDDLDEVSLPN